MYEWYNRSNMFIFVNFRFVFGLLLCVLFKFIENGFFILSFFFKLRKCSNNFESNFPPYHIMHNCQEECDIGEVCIKFEFCLHHKMCMGTLRYMGFGSLVKVWTLEEMVKCNCRRVKWDENFIPFVCWGCEMLCIEWERYWMLSSWNLLHGYILIFSCIMGFLNVVGGDFLWEYSTCAI